MEPRFKHNCTECIFLGVVEEADVYYCRQFRNSPTLTARYSDNPDDTMTGMFFAELGVEPFVTARKLAEEAKLIV